MDIKKALTKTCVTLLITSLVYTPSWATESKTINIENIKKKLELEGELERKKIEQEKREQEKVNKKVEENNKLHITIDAEIEKYIIEASEKYNIEQELIKAIIKHESDFRQNVISHAGAIGLMQLMPNTAKWIGVDPYDARENIDGGTRYISQQFKAFKRLDLALASYNAGEGNVRKYNGIPPFSETQEYVKKITNTYNKLKGGF